MSAVSDFGAAKRAVSEVGSGSIGLQTRGVAEQQRRRVTVRGWM